MLILKGDNGKGRIVTDLLVRTNSVCFTYGEYKVNSIDGSYFVDSKKYSLDDFMTCITEYTERYPERYYDYFVVYTNEKEENLKEFIAWLKYVEYFCRQIIVTCK